MPSNPKLPNLCLRESCGNQAHSRGLCQLDYALARYLVTSNKTTWENLEASGKALPSKQTRSRAKDIKDWFLDDAK